MIKGIINEQQLRCLFLAYLFATVYTLIVDRRSLSPVHGFIYSVQSMQLPGQSSTNRFPCPGVWVARQWPASGFDVSRGMRHNSTMSTPPIRQWQVINHNECDLTMSSTKSDDHSVKMLVCCPLSWFTFHFPITVTALQIITRVSSLICLAIWCTGINKT